MNEADYEKLMAQFERIKRECDTQEKATEQLKRDGILDENGDYAPQFRGGIIA